MSFRSLGSLSPSGLCHSGNKQTPSGHNYVYYHQGSTKITVTLLIGLVWLVIWSDDYTVYV